MLGLRSNSTLKAGIPGSDTVLSLISPMNDSCRDISSHQRPVLLLPWQRARFRTEGYIQLSNVVPKGQIDDCLRVLNHNLGIPNAVSSGGTQKGLGKLGGGLTQDPRVLALMSGVAWQWAEQFLGVGQIDFNLSPQIALRFPELVDGKGDVLGDGAYDMSTEVLPEKYGTDNRLWHTDPHRQGHTHNFSLLVGVALSDITTEYAGNLCVWPGSHLMIHPCKVGDKGAIDMDRLAQAASVEIQQEAESRDPILPDLGPPLQLTHRTGDIVVLHPDLAHAGGSNRSPCIRPMVYFRLKSRSLTQFDTKRNTMDEHMTSIIRKHMDNMWFDLPGVDV